VIFHDPEESSFLFFQDLAFLPLDIVLVTFVLKRVHWCWKQCTPAWTAHSPPR
jgi:hypothetical protein